jgi:phosphoribosylglycinamide formyltransferase-1
MQALASACMSGRVAAEVVAVVAPSGRAPAALLAADMELPVFVVDPMAENYGSRLKATLSEARVEWVCLAGYLRLLPEEVLDRYPGHILNIHPALLPKFGGKGMYGRHLHETVLQSGEQETGCTVHFVTSEYDEGEVILQRRCPVFAEDTPETIAARVLSLEHQAYPAALQKVLESHGGRT